jgi:hypothetical protein
VSTFNLFIKNKEYVKKNKKLIIIIDHVLCKADRKVRRENYKIDYSTYGLITLILFLLLLTNTYD